MTGNCDAVRDYLGSRHAIIVLLYIHANPGSCKTDVMRDVGNERTTYLRINRGIDLGLIRCDSGSNVHNKALLSLTEEGRRAAVLLDLILGGFERQSPHLPSASHAMDTAKKQEAE